MGLAALCVGLALTGTASALDDASPGVKPDSPLNERDLIVEVERPKAKLRVTMFFPPYGGPFPLALVNHGAAHEPKKMPKYGDEFIPYYFLSRGYAVALPLMRGYGDSEGRMAPAGCDSVLEGSRAAADIRQVLDVVKAEPGIDPSTIIVAGKSMGGWHTLAFGATQPADVRAIASFSGGYKESDCATPDQALIQGSATLGSKTKIKSIWFFGENDQIFSSSTWHAMFNAYKGAGAPTELVDVGTFQDDAHAVFASAAGLADWISKMDAFLASVGLPHTEIYPGYLPKSGPAATNYADINDPRAVPYLSEKVAKAYLDRFKSYPLPRAMAVGLGGASVISNAVDTSEAALADCQAHTSYCQLYAVDNSVVWTGQAGAPAATKFARLDDATAVPFLNPAGRAGYLNFLQLQRPRAFAVAPDGAWGSAAGYDAMTTALVRCGQGHEGCELYAVDANVVWPDTHHPQPRR